MGKVYSSSVPKCCKSECASWFQLIGQPNYIASFLFVVGTIDFFCSQSPYAMKGILLGMCYSLSGLNLAMQGLIALPFISKFIWDDVPLPCEFWYFLLQIFITLIFGIPFIAVMKWMYKKQSREDMLPNEQVFAIHVVLRTLCKCQQFFIIRV